MKYPWRQGNTVELLENGEAFFPRVFEAISKAQREVVLETFILFADKVGNELHAVVLAAAKRGVSIDMLVDGYGSPDLTDEWVGELTQAGVRFHVFDPQPRLLGVRTNVFRRMHRKIVVIDGTTAFVGGINYSADHLADFGPQAKQDYAVEVHGPVVEDIHRFALDAIAPLVPLRKRRPWKRWKGESKRNAQAEQQAEILDGDSATAQMLFVTRDNDAHQTDIERQYRLAIRAARTELIIANAYFFPGYRLLRDLRNAAKRGVKVRLILQGEPDMPIVKLAAGLLYGYLVRAGVKIYEYCERPLHGKVALADDQWATVGSSNLDPLSLSLNLEANLFVRDSSFNNYLRERLEHLIENHCKLITAEAVPARTPWRLAVGFVVFHFLRRFPSWSGWLPAHVPKLTSLSPHVHTDVSNA
ncbi:cardiolipin synthase ClsB [soil metagenome]